jgi:hypothetical protein
VAAWGYSTLTLLAALATEELLVKHGLVDSVLVSLTESLGQFDQALGRGAEGRRIHIAAAVELDVVAGDAVQIVRVMDGHNRVRFAGDPDLLAAWRSASNVIGPARTGGRADGRTGGLTLRPRRLRRKVL